MRVVQTVFGVFHHFDLARELHRRGMLERIFSTWPWARLKREGLPRERVTTFPWIHTPEYLLRRANLLPRAIEDLTGYSNALLFDEFTLRTIPECDVLVAISGSSLKTGQLVQRRGGKFICDRGSAHQRFQEQILQEEFSRWGVGAPPVDPRDTLREEKIYAEADAITVPSTFAANSFVDMGLPREKVHVLPYGVRLDRFKPAAEPPSPETFEVLFVGSISLQKGIPYLLEAFSRVHHPRKRFRIVGGVSREIVAVLPRLPQEQVEWVGMLPQAEVAAAMRASHLLVLGSVQEGMALVQAQAMACGCPVLATFNTGATDLFTDGVEGWIVPIRDVDALAHRMQQAADDRDTLNRMRLAAIERVQHIGGWERYGDQWEALLLSL